MSEYRSEIRESDVAALANKAATGNYRKYLKRIVLRKARGFTDRDVILDFPVTALVGPNGGGKTTILGAAGLIYRSVPPGDFFAKSGKYDESMKAWAIEYDLWDRDLNERIQIQRTASFKSLKWNRKAVNRKVLVFGVSRTVPASERRELTKAVGSKFARGSRGRTPRRRYQRGREDPREADRGLQPALCRRERSGFALRRPVTRGRSRLFGVPLRSRGGERYPHRLGYRSR